jgi:hypothetical protein
MLALRGAFILTFQPRDLAGHSEEFNARKLAAPRGTVCALAYKWRLPALTVAVSDFRDQVKGLTIRGGAHPLIRQGLSTDVPLRMTRILV